MPGRSRVEGRRLDEDRRGSYARAIDQDDHDEEASPQPTTRGHVPRTAYIAAAVLLAVAAYIIPRTTCSGPANTAGFLAPFLAAALAVTALVVDRRTPVGAARFFGCILLFVGVFVVTESTFVMTYVLHCTDY